MDKSTYSTYVERIQDISIKELTSKAVEIYATDETAEDAVQVTEWMFFLLKNDKLIADNNYALFVDVLAAASLLHNIAYKYGESDFENLFKARKLLNELNEDIKVPQTYIESIFQAIEGQLGKDHPMVLLIPNPNTPGAHFSLACSIYYKTKSKII
jgi:hypothetical protein